MKINLKIGVVYVGKARCEICQDHKDGVAFELEAWLPFGAATHSSRQPTSTFYCWDHFQQALSNPEFAIELVRTVDDRLFRSTPAAIPVHG